MQPFQAARKHTQHGVRHKVDVSTVFEPCIKHTTCFGLILVCTFSMIG